MERSFAGGSKSPIDIHSTGGVIMRDIFEGTRIIDFTNTVSGPVCTMLMGDMGAEVIKVERPGTGDEARFFPPYKDGMSASFVVMNHGKKSLTLDMRKPEGVQLFKELVAASDVLVENFRPGVMKKLGIDYDTLCQINPRLVMCSISGYGQFGPLSPLPAYDSVIQAASGLMSTTGFPENPPVRAGTLIMDMASSMFSAYAIAAALYGREKSGRGDYIDIAMYDVAVQFLEAKFMDYTINKRMSPRTGNRYPFVTPFDTYKTSDGYIMIICAGDHTFKMLAGAMGQPELADDERFKDFMKRNANEPALKEIIEKWTGAYTTKEVWDILIENGVPGAPVHSVQDVIEHPHTRERGLLQELEQPGAGTFTIPGPAYKARNSVMKARGPAPKLGEHNENVIRDILGKKPEEYVKIKSSGILG